MHTPAQSLFLFLKPHPYLHCLFSLKPLESRAILGVFGCPTDARSQNFDLSAKVVSTMSAQTLQFQDALYGMANDLSPPSRAFSSHQGIHMHGNIEAKDHTRMQFGHTFITRRSTSFNSKYRTQILNWLSPLTFLQTHERISNDAKLKDQSEEAGERNYSAGQWLLETDVFDKWRGQEQRMLWYYGMRKLIFLQTREYIL